MPTVRLSSNGPVVFFSIEKKGGPVEIESTVYANSLMILSLFLVPSNYLSSKSIDFHNQEFPRMKTYNVLSPKFRRRLPHVINRRNSNSPHVFLSRFRLLGCDDDDDDDDDVVEARTAALSKFPSLDSKRLAQIMANAW